jgi:hypothetical protein
MRVAALAATDAVPQGLPGLRQPPPPPGADADICDDCISDDCTAPLGAGAACAQGTC